MQKRRLNFIATIAITAIVAVAWFLYARSHLTFAVLTSPLLFVGMTAFGEWSNGSDVIRGWQRKKPPQ